MSLFGATSCFINFQFQDINKYFLFSLLSFVFCSYFCLIALDYIDVSMKKNKNEMIKSQQEVFSLESADGVLKITPLAPITYKNSSVYDKYFSYKSLLADCKVFILDLSLLKVYDSYLVIYLNELEQYALDNNIRFELVNDNDDILRILNILNPKKDQNISETKEGFWVKYFSNIGEIVKILYSDGYKFLEFVGELFIRLFKLPFILIEIRWKDFPLHITNTGVNAVPISMLIVFLIGIITGYQGAIQLKQFGADIFIATLVGISITRELSPLMAAIIVAGRSGSAFAAEIGTMKVSEEIDALTTMGFDRHYFLVLPRVLAVSLSMPLLVMLSNVAGIAGGLITGLSILDITLSGFMNQLQATLSFWDVFSGIFKSVIFGFLIATVGCFRGFQVQGGAESVGRYTTASVVTGILLIILVDAVFVFIFQSLGV